MTDAAASIKRRVQKSFAQQALMATLGARLRRVEAGLVEIGLPFGEHLTQQDGFLHAGAVTAVVDSACGYAALTRMRPGARVLSVEFKMNLLAPAGGALVARGRVVKAGRTLTVCAGEAVLEEDETPVAMMQATMIARR